MGYKESIIRLVPNVGPAAAEKGNDLNRTSLPTFLRLLVCYAYAILNNLVDQNSLCLVVSICIPVNMQPKAFSSNWQRAYKTLILKLINKLKPSVEYLIFRCGR